MWPRDPGGELVVANSRERAGRGGSLPKRCSEGLTHAARPHSPWAQDFQAKNFRAPDLMRTSLRSTHLQDPAELRVLMIRPGVGAWAPLSGGCTEPGQGPRGLRASRWAESGSGGEARTDL